jgi:hypothetical protein
MDPTLAAEPSGFLGWVSTYGNVVFFVAQIIYWFGILVFVGYAVAQYKRWVNFQMGVGKSGELRKAEESADKNAKVSVDQFVE